MGPKNSGVMVSIIFVAMYIKVHLHFYWLRHEVATHPIRVVFQAHRVQPTVSWYGKWPRQSAYLQKPLSNSSGQRSVSLLPPIAQLAVLRPCFRDALVSLFARSIIRRYSDASCKLWCRLQVDLHTLLGTVYCLSEVSSLNDKSGYDWKRQWRSRELILCFALSDLVAISLHPSGSYVWVSELWKFFLAFTMFTMMVVLWIWPLWLA